MGAQHALGYVVKDFADGWIYCPTLEAANREAEGAGNLVAAVADVFPVYIRERSRILSNAACYLGLARRLAYVSHDGGRGYRLARKAEQLDLARLRSSWAPIRAAVAKGVQS